MKETKTAIFAGGCFWCMVKPFDEQPGIRGIVSGYTGGTEEDAVYERVKTGTTNHREAVEIVYEPDVFPYEKLLELYWQQVDPTDDGGQFFDRGPQYRTAVFYQDEEQRQLAAASREALDKNGPFHEPVVTEILPARPFYPAEEHHQKFYKKNPDAYQKEREESGREDFLKHTWQEKSYE
ncbi:peptide-methionine (S)-S-oxide reductase MsrA [Alkalicoccus urumqiensis]|uniref:Peptide methionine sulfoxide reductase MsrA n=1 Tax=Alkalicoccus urumqiensis TaxID=1548213 RepID=A0A2P6MKV6_ALKUR|nr:peptide-methionine (S)-S-oxide reductase MsrA [Alkalicoccus urumqiensis]PRO66918.1 peptide-methionine (S)-S-oxide reductase [Alkalicoccus urumqiensis]